jgi:hypothetical protein
MVKIFYDSPGPDTAIWQRLISAMEQMQQCTNYKIHTKYMEVNYNLSTRGE